MYLNEYGQQIEIMTQQLGMIEQQRLESTAAIESIRAIQENEDGIALLPIGGGVFLRAKVLDAGHFLVNIGADVSVEQAGADAVEYLEDRITELEALGKKVQVPSSSCRVRQRRSRGALKLPTRWPGRPRQVRADPDV